MTIELTRKRSIFFVLGTGFLVAVFLCIGFGYYLVSPAGRDRADRIFKVRPGATLKEVVSGLRRRGLISSEGPLLLWARVMGYGRHIKSGEYRLNPSMPPVRILAILNKGAILTHLVTIPEGYTRRQIAALLEKKGLADRREFLALTGDPKIAKRFGLPGPDLEGYLYPDTYAFAKGLSTLSIIGTMVRRFREVTAPFRARAAERGLSMKQVVILASMVEKETGRAGERPMIADVFLNRLKKGMRLESDPTVIYGITDFDGNLRKRDLKKRSPYNTYVIRGLPRGPIANPGEAAIRAVLYPAGTDYLYFVSRNDGTHCFSTTLKAHLQAVETFQKRRRKRPAKSP